MDFTTYLWWFALCGYGIRIIKEFSKGKFKKLPVMKFGEDFSFGVIMFVKAIPFILVYMILVGLITTIAPGALALTQFFLALFVIPILSVNFMNKETVGSFFEFKVLKPVFDNLGDYLMAVLKTLDLAIIFLLMVLILVGIPAGQFTKNIS